MPNSAPFWLCPNKNYYIIKFAQMQPKTCGPGGARRIEMPPAAWYNKGQPQRGKRCLGAGRRSSGPPGPRKGTFMQNTTFALRGNIFYTPAPGSLAVHPESWLV